MPTSVPAAAVEAVDQLLADPGLNADERGLLDALKGDAKILTNEIWPRIARNLPGQEGAVVEAVLLAYQQAHGFRRPMPAPNEPAAVEAWAAECAANAVPAPAALAVCAEFFANSMKRAGLGLRERFDAMRGEGQPDYDAMVALIEQAGEIFNAVAALLAAAPALEDSPPLPRKRGDANAARTHFSRILSWYFGSLLKAPCDQLVSAMTAVAFRPGRGAEPSARSLRRQRVAHSPQKQA